MTAGQVGWDVVLAERLYRAERPLAEIARAVGVSTRAVTKYGERHGWPRRGRGWHPGVPAGTGKSAVRRRAQIARREAREAARALRPSSASPSPSLVSVRQPEAGETLPVPAPGLAPRRRWRPGRVRPVRCPECQRETRRDPCERCYMRLPLALARGVGNAANRN